VAKTQQPKPKSKFSQPSAAQRRLAAKQAVARASAERSSKRRRRWMTFYVPSIVILIVIIVMVLVSVLKTSPDNPGNTSADAGSVASLVTGVSPTVLDNVGIGTAQSPPTQTTGDALKDGSKPRILYVGAEWCPFCAAERWPLTVALSRFGTFTGLSQTKSASDDVYPNTPTLSYATSTYTSSYISFSGDEIQDGNKKTIKTLPTSDEQLFQSLGKGSFPFVDIGGRYLQTSAQYAPDLLAGKTQQQVAQALSDPESTIAQAVDGAANALTAAICKVTNNQPSNVCTASGVMAASNTLQ
jgi:hypothetical protein